MNKTELQQALDWWESLTDEEKITMFGKFN